MVGSTLAWIALVGWDKIDYSDVPLYSTWLVVFFAVTLAGNALDTMMFICYGRKHSLSDPVGQGFGIPIWVVTILLCIFQVVWYGVGSSRLFRGDGVLDVYGSGSLQFKFAIAVFVLQTVFLVIAFLAVVAMAGFSLWCGDGLCGFCCSTETQHQWCFQFQFCTGRW